MAVIVMCIIYLTPIKVLNSYSYQSLKLVVQGVSGFVDILTPPLTLDRMVQS